MIQTIIFSFNRALQLHALLESMRRFWPQSEPVAVLYNYKGDEFGKGYEHLKKRFPSCSFAKESNPQKEYYIRNLFTYRNLRQWGGHKYIRSPKTNFHSLLRKICLETKEPLIMFLTDDSVFIDHATIDSSIATMIMKDPFQCSYSLRLGKNIDGPTPQFDDNNNLFQWDYRDHSLGKNWKYPFSVDGHIYSSAFIRKAIDSVLFCNPNTFEPNVCAFAREHGFLNVGVAEKTNKLLSYPLNMVQSVCDNESCNVSTTLLNQYYLDGWLLNLPQPEHATTFQQYPDIISLIKGETVKQLVIKGIQQ